MSTEMKLRTGGRTLAVTVVPDAGGFAGSVDGTAHRIAAVVATATASVGSATVEELALEIDGRPVHAVVARTRDRIHVALDADTFVFERVDDTVAGGDGGAGSGKVVSPMPGKVVKVLVAVGDAVTAGQPLVVIEAMKMETTLAAEIDGTVHVLDATPGAMIDAGAVLVVLMRAGATA